MCTTMINEIKQYERNKNLYTRTSAFWHNWIGELVVLAVCECVHIVVWVTGGLHAYTRSKCVCVTFSHVFVRSEFNMAAHQFETPTSTIAKSESTNDRQRKNENIGVLPCVLSQSVSARSVLLLLLHVRRSNKPFINAALNGNDIVSLTWSSLVAHGEYAMRRWQGGALAGGTHNYRRRCCYSPFFFHSNGLNDWRLALVVEMICFCVNFTIFAFVVKRLCFF